jgi:anti-sigma B factor antagonist
MSDTPDKAPAPAAVTVEKTPGGGAVVARAQVKMLDDEALKTLTRQIDDACTGGGVQLVVIELSKVTILPSMALGLLVQIANKCKSREQRLKLAGVPPQVRQVFSITRLDRVFQFADSVDAALAQQ